MKWLNLRTLWKTHIIAVEPTPVLDVSTDFLIRDHFDYLFERSHGKDPHAIAYIAARVSHETPGESTEKQLEVVHKVMQSEYVAAIIEQAANTGRTPNDVIKKIIADEFGPDESGPEAFNPDLN